MNKQYQTPCALFEWDTDKAARNLKKHGVSFELATQAFTDTHACVMYDAEHSLQEDRYILIGTAGNIVLVQVVFTEQNVIRIISARKATNMEQKLYARLH